MPNSKPIKRTRTARLLLMGVSPLMLTACDGSSQPPADVTQDSTAQMYATPEACAASGDRTLEQCKVAFEDATAEHEQLAPHYATYQECVAQYGENHCGASRDGSGSFVPFMMGMLIGRSFGGGYSQPAPVYYPSPSYGRNDPSGGMTGTNGKATYQTLPSTAQSRAITESRAGFGSQSAARGSWGSSSRGG